mgnify:CR=1 FL=1
MRVRLRLRHARVPALRPPVRVPPERLPPPDQVPLGPMRQDVRIRTRAGARPPLWSIPRRPLERRRSLHSYSIRGRFRSLRRRSSSPLYAMPLNRFRSIV